MKFTQRPAELVGEKLFIAAKDGSLRPVVTFDPLAPDAASAVLLAKKGGDSSVYQAVASLALEHSKEIAAVPPESFRTALGGEGEGVAESVAQRYRKEAGKAFRALLVNRYKVPESVLAERTVSNCIGVLAGALAMQQRITSDDGRIMGYHAVRLGAKRTPDEAAKRAGAEFAAAVLKYVRAGSPAVHQLKVALESQEADSTRYVNPADVQSILLQAAYLVADLVPSEKAAPVADEAGE